MKYNKVSKSYNQLTVAEKALERGVKALSDVELVQAMIGSGISIAQASQIADDIDIISKNIGLEFLNIDDLMAIKGVGSSKATLFFASLEYWRRKHIKSLKPIINTSQDAAKQFSELCDKKQEHFMLLTLDGARQLINKHLISIGTLMSSLVHPREVFAPAIADRAASIIVAHNHPSGSKNISTDDKEATRKLREAGELLGIRLDDHIIIVGNEFISVLQDGGG